MGGVECFLQTIQKTMPHKTSAKKKVKKKKNLKKLKPKAKAEKREDDDDDEKKNLIEVVACSISKRIPSLQKSVEETSRAIIKKVETDIMGLNVVTGSTIPEYDMLHDKTILSEIERIIPRKLKLALFLTKNLINLWKSWPTKPMVSPNDNEYLETGTVKLGLGQSLYAHALFVYLLECMDVGVESTWFLLGGRGKSSSSSKLKEGNLCFGLYKATCLGDKNAPDEILWGESRESYFWERLTEAYSLSSDVEEEKHFDRKIQLRIRVLCLACRRAQQENNIPRYAKFVFMLKEHLRRISADHDDHPYYYPQQAEAEGVVVVWEVFQKIMMVVQEKKGEEKQENKEAKKFLDVYFGTIKEQNLQNSNPLPVFLWLCWYKHMNKDIPKNRIISVYKEICIWFSKNYEFHLVLDILKRVPKKDQEITVKKLLSFVDIQLAFHLRFFTLEFCTWWKERTTERKKEKLHQRNGGKRWILNTVKNSLHERFNKGYHCPNCSERGPFSPVSFEHQCQSCGELFCSEVCKHGYCCELLYLF